MRKHLHLEPGEIGAMNIRLPPEIVRRLKAGGKLEVTNGAIRRDGISDAREVFVSVDGEAMGTFLIRWQGDEACLAVVTPEGGANIVIAPERKRRTLKQIIRDITTEYRRRQKGQPEGER